MKSRKVTMAQYREANGLPPIAKDTEPPRHPDDIKMEEESKRLAAEKIDAYLRTIPVSAMKNLILTYSDADAEEYLFVLREKFWSEV